MGTMLANAISQADKKVQYDVQAKQVLSNKYILAWILKRVAREFQKMSVEQIVACIEKPEVDTVFVDPGATNRLSQSMEKITGLSNESPIHKEGTIFYDIRFFVNIPGKERETMKLIVNVEAQKAFETGYEIVTRGIFYGARMISAQLGTEFRHMEYDKIKKVYSIWICMNAPAYIGNAISVYAMEKQDLLPGLPDKRFAYDKITVVIVALNEKTDSKDPCVTMLNTLFSPQIDTNTKVNLLETQYQIPVKRKFREELSAMCNLSEYVFDQGREKGKAEGKAEGEAKGRRDIIIEMVKQKISDDTICTVAKISRGELEKIKEEMLVLQ